MHSYNLFANPVIDTGNSQLTAFIYILVLHNTAHPPWFVL